MQHNRYLPTTLITVAIVYGCSSMPQSSSLTEAHQSYDNVRTNPEVTHLAALELKVADASLNKADYAFSEHKSDDIIDHLAYIAKQQVTIAEQTAKWKTAELAAVNAAVKRDLARRLARTAAEAAKQRMIAQQTVNPPEAEPAIVDINPERDRKQMAQQEMQLKTLNAKKTGRGLMITLEDVLFRANKAQLDSGGMRNVQKVANFLNQYPQYKVAIEGRTDSMDSSCVDQELSDRRADTVSARPQLT